MPRPRLSTILAVAAAASIASPAVAQRRATARAASVNAESLRVKLFALAHDSMGGRDTGSPGNVKAADWVAATFARYGLQPAGDNGTWFQTIPFLRTRPDTSRGVSAGGTALVVGRDLVPLGLPTTFIADLKQAAYGGVLGDSSTYPLAEQTAGKLVVFAAPANLELRASNPLMGAARRNPRFANAAGIALALMEAVGTDLIDQFMQGRVSTDTTPFAGRPVTLLVTRRAAAALIGGDLASVRSGQAGPMLTGQVTFVRGPLAYPARNVVGILRGSDPALAGTYVSLSAHNDHVGYTREPVDHDSARAFNRVVRPMGADSRMREPTADEAARIAQLRDSLRAAHAPRQDSIFNGADDDGTGTVALMELARVLSAGPRPKRSLLFVNHAAEERGLLGSAWYTDHATVPVDSIVAEIDEDMIGRGDATDLPHGGPAYLEVVGARRLSAEFGDTLEAVSRRLPLPFVFNYEFDAPGHPLQYYCRADHYNYARYGIPAVAFSRGEHLDYHQVTDEAQYIDYDNMARVVTLVEGAARAIANMDHRPRVNGPHGDPHAQCRQ